MSSDEDILLSSLMCDHVDVFSVAAKCFDSSQLSLWCDEFGRSLIHIAVSASAHYCLANLLSTGEMKINAR
jgi:hypothetical protein